MKGLLLQFYEPYVAGAIDSEKTFNPDITEMKVIVNGTPNKVYSRGMKTSGKRSLKDLKRKTARWMQQTFMPETDSVYSSISGVWETVIFMKMDWDWWIRRKEFSSQWTGMRKAQGILNVTSSSPQTIILVWFDRPGECSPKKDCCRYWWLERKGKASGSENVS